MPISWMQICAIAHAFAIAHNGHVSLDEEKHQILLYENGSVVFQLPKLIIVPAKLNPGAWAIHLVRGYHLPRLAFPPTYLEQRFNDLLLEAWNRAAHDGGEEL
jgi:hypothetical protein